MTGRERRERIITLLKKTNVLSVKELSEQFEVSVPTLYKDLDILEQRRFIHKSYGEIRLIEEEKYRHNFFKQRQVRADSKRKIAQKALSYITNGQTIFLDASTTTFYLCEALKNSDLQNVTVVTNSVFIPMELLMNENFTVVCIGGYLERSSAEYISAHPERFIEDIHANTFFFSARSLSPEKGILDYYNPNDIRTKQMLFDNADTAVCLADSTKFSNGGTVNWVGYDRLRTIITDEEISPEVLACLRDKGVTVIVT
jgi:DeoR family transcriptional regulator, fructose operon transcriptional repressor